jgi:spore coat protein CotH
MGKLKRNLKVEFDRHNDKQRFHGLKTLNLNAGAADPTKLREALAYAIYRDAGVPAPRTAFANVSLTVPGKYDNELLGLYTVVEQVNKTFLKERFGDASGLLMKPERMLRGMEYLGEDWAAYKDRYLPKRDATPAEAKRVIAFVDLINRADDARFRQEIASYVDVDKFLRFLAVTAMLANLDSLFTLGHNYYLYLHPKTNQFTFFPWDVDLSFAGFPFMATPEQQMDLSLTHPYPGESKLADRLLAMKDVAAKYQKLLAELSATVFTKERLLKDIAAAEAVTKDILAREAKATAARKETGGFDFNMFGRTPDLKTFAEKRTASVADQVAGKSKGHVPAGGFGFGQPQGNPLARPLLESLDADKSGKVSEDEMAAGMRKLFHQWDANRDGSVDQKELADGLQRLLPPPKFGPGGPPRKGPPKGNRP